MAYLNDQIEDFPSPISLRRELSCRALALAASEKHLHEVLDGEIPSIIETRRDATGIFTPLRTKEFARSLFGLAGWKKSILPLGNRNAGQTGDGWNWIARIVRTHC